MSAWPFTIYCRMSCNQLQHLYELLINFGYYVEIMKLPLMRNNILREDLDALIEYLKQDDPILTQSANVRAFEEEWAQWLGTTYSVFVNSGASANWNAVAF